MVGVSNKALITRAPMSDILPAYSRSLFTLSLVNESILNLTFISNPTLLVALHMILQLTVVPGNVPMMGTGESRTRDLLCTSGQYDFKSFSQRVFLKTALTLFYTREDLASGRW
jgi:hypothetical protein